MPLTSAPSFRSCQPSKQPAANTVCPPKRNGSMPVAPERRLATTLGTIPSNWATTRGIGTTQIAKRTRLEARNPTHLACTICMATSGNGAMTGISRRMTKRRPNKTRLDPRRAIIGCFAGEVGEGQPRFAELPVVFRSTLIIAMTMWVSASSWCRPGLRIERPPKDQPDP